MDILLLNQFYNANINALICIFTPCNSTLYDGFEDFIHEDKFFDIYYSGAEFIIDPFAINGNSIQITITRYIRDNVIYELI